MGPSASVGAHAAAPLSLRQARAMLDEQHYGLDKIKDRCVGVWVGDSGCGRCGRCVEDSGCGSSRAMHAHREESSRAMHALWEGVHPRPLQSRSCRSSALLVAFVRYSQSATCNQTCNVVEHMTLPSLSPTPCAGWWSTWQCCGCVVRGPARPSCASSGRQGWARPRWRAGRGWAKGRGKEEGGGGPSLSAGQRSTSFWAIHDTCVKAHASSSPLQRCRGAGPAYGAHRAGRCAR